MEEGEHITERLAALAPVLQKIALGDFLQKIDIPEKEDELTEHLTALRLMTAKLQSASAEIYANTDTLLKQNKQLTEMSAKLEEEKHALEARVEERTRELQKKADEFERINKIMINRELKMIELKHEIEKLEKKSEIS
jgi:methyl-accepting chemotaxis protein